MKDEGGRSRVWRLMEESWSSGDGARLETSDRDTRLLRSKSLPLSLDCLTSQAGVGVEGSNTRRTESAGRCGRPLLTLRRHYYPEGGWGWFVFGAGCAAQLLAHGLQQAAPVLSVHAVRRFGPQYREQAGWLGAVSAAAALLMSPVTVALCVRKSTRVTAVLGGLLTALGCLFTSFATQFHQLFFSYGAVVGLGAGMTRDCSTLMVAQYFKRRRELVEILLVSSSGIGTAVMSAFIRGTIAAVGWRLGLQAVTGVVFLTFILGMFYRSASLYHPQRRAILHLKNQNKIKRKLKDRTKNDDRQPFFDFSTLKSKTVRILLVSTGISAFGVNTPIYFLAYQAEEEGAGSAARLQGQLGAAWAIGCAAFGLLLSGGGSGTASGGSTPAAAPECRVARQYAAQAAILVCGLATLALAALTAERRGYVMFAWVYGFFCGGYHYSLKMYTYERVRSRNFARTWGFVQCSQAVPIAIGVPLSGYMNAGYGGNAGYYFSSICSVLGSLTLFCVDVHRRNLARKHSRVNGAVVGGATTCGAACVGVCGCAPSQSQQAPTSPSLLAVPATAPAIPELTCISEEGGLDNDLDLDMELGLPRLLDDYDCQGDCITSCNKVENYLMLSEYENNLIAELPTIVEKRGRRWSLINTSNPRLNQNSTPLPTLQPPLNPLPPWRRNNKQLPSNRIITVISEASL